MTVVDKLFRATPWGNCCYALRISDITPTIIVFLYTTNLPNDILVKYSTRSLYLCTHLVRTEIID